ncbi:ATPase [Stappia sp. F7233]|uniref:ATPase n=1 Tax=Stappia albiluteola TaxID=2758565 RepID=A0A839AG87_9HYPH|nr:ATP12 family protein [Stappia albiluteola]MBA5777944.1 ATPase [Stappia albiluteola]
MRDILEDLSGEPPIDPVERAKELSRRELPKRFYEKVSVEERDGGHAILLDGRPVRTPARRVLALPGARLAQAVAGEWERQEKVIDPATMPLTRIANSALDGVADRLKDVADTIAEYAGSDLLCYRADSPEKLVGRQNAAWDPVLAWAETRLGRPFSLACGLMPVAQDAALLAAFRAALDERGPLEIAALHTVTTLTGSAVLALALGEGAFEAEAVWSAAHVDEDWNIEQWGEDAEAAARRAARHAEFAAAALILADARV